MGHHDRAEGGETAERDERGKPSADDVRDPAARLRDHAAVDRLVDELLPALIAKLGATGLGEIEVREGAWKVRLRRPADAPEPKDVRRSGERPSRAQPGHAGHGHAPAAVESHRSARDAGTTPGGAPAANGAHQARPHLAAVGPGLDPGARIARMGHLPEDDSFPPVEADGAPPADRSRAVATSPAVGIFHARAEATSGTRVRVGDRLGTVDVLGVPHDVVAPVDGLVGASLVEPGEAVEYGQELIRIELAETSSAQAGAAQAGAGHARGES